MRVLLVKDKKTGDVLKVCENYTSFKQWLDHVEVSRDVVKLTDRAVREEQ